MPGRFSPLFVYLGYEFDGPPLLVHVGHEMDDLLFCVLVVIVEHGVEHPGLVVVVGHLRWILKMRRRLYRLLHGFPIVLHH
ncbi:Uncharacterised protein [Mycobacterium tuberculosis]|nr:Uncharacterised protein [Mycobacterium tuberculosis]